MLLTGTPMGAMILLAGVADPLTNYLKPPRSGVPAESAEAAQQAMSHSLLHFGLHAWAVFCLPTLAFAYFAHRRGLPSRVSSVLHPLLGKRIHGPIGRTVDVLALTAAVLGTAALLASGASALGDSMAELAGSSGLQRFAPTPLLLVVAVVLALVLILLLSARLARSGPDTPVWWSRLGAFSMGLLLLFVLVTGSLSFLANGTTQSVGNYLGGLVPLSFFTDAFANSGRSGDQQVLHWTWLLTVAPYVGIVLARLTAGFTIRDW